jgi:sporulation protein YlmC with PRC-barrel domain
VTGRVLMAALHLLDHQLVDRDGVLVGKVDDLELVVGPDGTAMLGALLSGPGVLATRMGHGTYGRWRERMETAIDGPEGRTSRISLSAVRRISSGVELALPAPLLATYGSERWVGDHVIGRLPGGRQRREDGPQPGAPGVVLEGPPDGARSAQGSTPGRDHPGGRVRASSVLRREVVDTAGAHLGHVLDIRMVQDGPVGAGFDAAIRIDGIVVGQGRAPQRAGLFRQKVHGPWLLRQLARVAAPRRGYIPWHSLRVETIAADADPVLATGEMGPVPGE